MRPLLGENGYELRGSVRDDPDARYKTDPHATRIDLFVICKKNMRRRAVGNRMDRRAFLATAGVVVCAGCVSDEGARPSPEIHAVRLENHRRDTGYDFTVRIEDADEIAFEKMRRLGPAGEGEAYADFERPVADPGDYTVRVEAGGHSARIETETAASEDEPCLHLEFYLGASTLHAEHVSYQRCEPDDDAS